MLFLFFLYTFPVRDFSLVFILLFIVTMDLALIQTIQQDSIKDERPEITTGMEVEVHQIIKEGNKERIQKFKGLVIKTHGKTTLDKTITVRKDVDGVGIEKKFPIYSPGVAKIEVLRSFKVRRKNITFIRELKGKAARLKEVR